MRNNKKKTNDKQVLKKVGAEKEKEVEFKGRRDDEEEEETKRRRKRKRRGQTRLGVS